MKLRPMKMQENRMLDMPTHTLPDWLRRAPRGSDDPAGAARDLMPLVQASGAEGARLGYVPDSVIRPVAEAGLFGMLLSGNVGGADVDTGTYIDAIEALSYADGSTGWVVMATGFSSAIAETALGAAAVESIFGGDEGYVAAGHISKLGTARRVKGGYRIEGEFQFGSGSRYASWFLGAFQLVDDNGPVRNEAGKPTIVCAFVPRSSVLLQGNWDVMGLVATQSCDFAMADQFVADEFTMDPVSSPRPIRGVGVAIGHAAWALGVGRRVLDEVRTLANGKRRFGRTSLIEQPVFQSDYARHYGAMRAAGSFVREAFGRWYQEAGQGEVGLETRAAARLAACWSTGAAVEAGHFAYLAAGSDSLRNKDGENDLQRCFRDIHAGSQHALIDYNILREASAALLGVAPPDLRL